MSFYATELRLFVRCYTALVVGGDTALLGGGGCFFESPCSSLLLKRDFSNHPVPLSKEGSTSFPKPFSPQGTRDVTALRCSEPLRYKVGGPIKGLARLCGLGSPGVEWGQACWDRLAKGGAAIPLKVGCSSVHRRH